MIVQSILSILLRSLTLLSKFIFLIFIARFLGPKQLGDYGLITASISVVIYILGADFYIYNTREILKSDQNNVPILIRDQFIFHLLLYVVILPICLFLFVFNLIQWNYFLIFYLLLVSEHLSQECYRLLITLSRPIFANFILFIRSGIWIYILIILFVFFDKIQSLNVALLAWFLGGLFSIILTLYGLKKLDWSVIKNQQINWKWIKTGVLNSLIFLLSSICIQLIPFLERIVLKKFEGTEKVGIYTYYSNITNTVLTFIVTGVFTILYPKLIKSYQNGNFEEYKKIMKKISIFGSLGGLIVIILAVIGIQIVLLVSNNAIYYKNIHVYWILLFSVFMNILSYIPHYALYVRKVDKYIMFSALGSLIVSILSNIILVPRLGIIGTAISNFLATTSLFILKIIFIQRINKL
ncbi:oligosaccharide flippase family protein [Aeribacillus sp. FSL M8-0254]|uniref:oligosaccharide flippase family protein n=1 Tax=Aeribacillus sp. FSL M8-0254 TaxID=2954577 RepID=UPI0030FC268B